MMVDSTEVSCGKDAPDLWDALHVAAEMNGSSLAVSCFEREFVISLDSVSKA